MTKLATTILKDAAACFQSARQNIYEGAKLLYQIQQEQLWEGQYSSFTDYLESECQLSKGFVSKLLTAWEYYVVQEKVSHAKLLAIDPEKLYLATRLPRGTVEQRLVKAENWTREDFRDALHSTDGGDCKHPEDKRVILCGQCGKRVG